MNKKLILAGLLATSVTYIHVSYGAGSVTGFSVQPTSSSPQSAAATQHSPGYYQPRMRTAPQLYVAPTPKTQRPYTQTQPAQVAPSGRVGLNPQPEPPSRGYQYQAPRGRVGLNPQPDPPSQPSQMQAPHGKVGLNPQPEPPSRYQAPRANVGLNPQPDPPSKGRVPGY